MYFSVLGPIEVREGDRLVPLPRQKQRALLSLLLLHAGEAVSTDRLLDALWGEQPPRTARGSLHNCVSQLRRALGAETLLTRAHGYVLDVAPEDVDLGRFERLVYEAREAPDSERADKLREALALWRGPPLAELTFESFTQPVIQQLEERRLTVVEERVDADLALGRHAELIGELERLVDEHPLRERLRGQLMLALYRAGRQAEALEVYQAARRVLVEELGIEPSPALRELEGAILRQDPALSPPAPTAFPEPRQLHKTATILFAEIAAVDTGPAEADPDTLHAATVRASHELRAAIEYHGGTIERFAGDELMAIFGAPVAHEDDPLRAARAAVQLRRALAGLDEAGADGIRIELRAAVATGDVTVSGASGRLDLTGAVVGFVRRLAESAEPGEILVDAATAKRGGHKVLVEPAEPRTLRGRREPVAFSRLADVAETAALGTSEQTPFVGRSAEIAQLRRAFARATRKRRCGVAAVLGEPGIGKSRLVTAFTQSLGAEATTLIGRCVSYGEGATYLPLAEAISQAVGEPHRERIAELLAGEEEAVRIAQPLAEIVARTPGKATVGEVFWAVRRLLERLAQERPVILVLEDAHWAEQTVLDLVEYLRARSAAGPLLVLCLARPELLEKRPDWAAEATVIPVEPLAAPDAAELVELVDHDVLSPEAHARVVELAEGNPLFAEQLVAFLRDEAAGDLEAIPPSLEALVSSRLDRLEPGVRDVLQRAAVIGREFWHGAVLHLSPPLDIPAVGRHLVDLAQKGLVDPATSAFPREDAFRFNHVLIREVAYGIIPREVRAELHERVADWIDLYGPAPEELAGNHLEQAYRLRTEGGSADGHARRLASDAGDRLASAGLRAAKRGDTAAAMNLLGRASSLLPERETTRRDLLAELGIAVWRAGDVGSAEEVLGNAVSTAAREHDRRAELRAQLELANLNVFRKPKGGADELLSLAAHAIPVLEELGDDRALGRTWYATAFVCGGLHCQYRQSLEAAEQAAEHLRRSGWSIAPCLQELAAGLYYGPTAVPTAVQRCDALLEQADRGGEAHVLAFRAGLEAMAGRFDEARALSLRARTTYEDLAWTIHVWTNCATVAADIELLAGDAAAAESILAESCKTLQEWGEQAHLATQATQLGQAVYAQARYAEALHWAGVGREAAASDDAGAQFLWRALQAKALAQLDQLEEAEALAREAVARASETDASSQHANTLLDGAEVLRLAGRVAESSESIKDAVRLFDEKRNVAGSRKARGVLSAPAPA